MRLLLISNSTNAGEAYLAYPMPRIGEFLCRLRAARAGAFLGIRHPRPLGAPRRRSRGDDPPCRSDLRRRRQHLRAGQKDAGAGADAGDPQPGEGGCPLRGLEFVAANPRRYAVGLREGCMLRYENGRLELLGSRPMRIFKKGLTPYEVQPGDDLSFLL